MTGRRRVLFLCTGNPARSQMAQGLVNHFLGDLWEAHSAGTRPAERVHALAVEALAELGIDILGKRPKSTAAFQGADLDLVVTVCDDAAEHCPLWLGRGRRAHLGFPDPAWATGSREEQLAVFRQVRDDIRRRVLAYLVNWEGDPSGLDDSKEMKDAAAKP